MPIAIVFRIINSPEVVEQQFLVLGPRREFVEEVLLVDLLSLFLIRVDRHEAVFVRPK